MSNDNTYLGKASLWTAIMGVVLPLTLAVLVAVVLKAPNEQQRREYEELRQNSYALCGVLFVGLALVALGCGIAARRTATGKAGLIVSVVVLLLFSFVVLWKTLPAKKPSEPASSPEGETVNNAPNEPEVRRNADKGEGASGKSR